MLERFDDDHRLSGQSPGLSSSGKQISHDLVGNLHSAARNAARPRRGPPVVQRQSAPALATGAVRPARGLDRASRSQL